MLVKQSGFQNVAQPQGGPLPVVCAVMTPISGVITPITHVFSAIYRGPNSYLLKVFLLTPPHPVVLDCICNRNAPSEAPRDPMRQAGGM